MNETILKVGMKPPHPGAFIREVILDELQIPVARAAEALAERARHHFRFHPRRASIGPF